MLRLSLWNTYAHWIHIMLFIYRREMQRVEWRQLREILGWLRILFWNWTRVNILGKSKTPSNTLTIFVCFNQIWDEHAGGRWRCRDQGLRVDLQRQAECRVSWWFIHVIAIISGRVSSPWDSQSTIARPDSAECRVTSPGTWIQCTDIVQWPRHWNKYWNI